MPDKTQPEDILDQVKKAEKAVKIGLLMKRISDLKDLSRDILEAKEESVMILEEIGIKAEDVKRIIDFVGSSVSLSEEDRKDIRARVRNENEQKKEKVQDQMEKNYTYTSSATNAISTAGTSASWAVGGLNGPVTFSNGVDTLNVGL